LSPAGTTSGCPFLEHAGWPLNGTPKLLTQVKLVILEMERTWESGAMASKHFDDCFASLDQEMSEKDKRRYVISHNLYLRSIEINGSMK
jgi:hypothetical protein